MKKLFLLPLAFLAITGINTNLMAQKEPKKVKKVKIVTQKDNEPKKVMEWDGEGEMPKEMKEYLNTQGLDLKHISVGKGKGKITMKGLKKGKNGEKDATFDFVMPEMPDMTELNKQLERLDTEFKDYDKKVHIYKFDEKNMEKIGKDMEKNLQIHKFDEKNMEKWGKDMEKWGEEMEKWGKKMEGMKIDIKDFDGKDFSFKFNCDSMKSANGNAFIFRNGKRDSLRVNARIFKKLDRLERLKDLKEGTTETTQEIDLGNGKKAKITTTRIITITQDPNAKVEEQKADTGDNLKVYPNPNQGIFTLEFTPKSTGHASIAILDGQGKVIYQDEVKDMKETYKSEIKLPEISTPNCILRVTQGGKVYTKQILVTK